MRLHQSNRHGTHGLSQVVRRQRPVSHFHAGHLGLAHHLQGAVTHDGLADGDSPGRAGQREAPQARGARHHRWTFTFHSLHIQNEIQMHASNHDAEPITLLHSPQRYRQTSFFTDQSRGLIFYTQCARSIGRHFSSRYRSWVHFRGT